MGRFCVYVLGDNPEEQLKQYDTRLPESFEDTTDLCREEYESLYGYVVVFKNGTWCTISDKRLKPFWKDKNGNCRVLKLPKNSIVQKVAFKKLYPTFDEFMEKWKGRKKNADGRYGIYCKNNGRWNSYRFGGIWENVLQLKDGTRATAAKWGDIDVRTTDVPYAILNNGDWHDRSEFGARDSSKQTPTAQWLRSFREILESLSPDTLVSVYECHI